MTVFQMTTQRRNSEPCCENSASWRLSSRTPTSLHSWDAAPREVRYYHQQLCCCDMCKILAWSNHQNYNYNEENFDKIQWWADWPSLKSSLFSEPIYIKCVMSVEFEFEFIMTVSEPVYLILEYAARGTLQTLLRSYRLPWTASPPDKYSPYANLPPMRKLTYRDLLAFAQQAASGMDYIASRDVSMVWLLGSGHHSGIILCMRPTNERWCYNVTLSPFGWAHTKMITGH